MCMELSVGPGAPRRTKQKLIPEPGHVVAGAGCGGFCRLAWEIHDGDLAVVFVVLGEGSPVRAESLCRGRSWPGPALGGWAPIAESRRIFGGTRLLLCNSCTCRRLYTETTDTPQDPLAAPHTTSAVQ